MKKFFCFFLSVVGVYGQIDVEKGLLIGVNIDNHPAKVTISLVSDSFGEKIAGASFQYDPASGSLKTAIDTRVKDIAAQFTPPIGFEGDTYYLFGQLLGQAEFAFFQVSFKLVKQGGRWIIPPEVLDVKLNYGASLAFSVPGAKEIRLRLFKGGQQTASFSTARPFDGYGFSFSPCAIAATQSALDRGKVLVSTRYAVPSLWDGTWDYGEMDFVADDGSATINILDGSVIGYSSPPPAFLVFPSPKLEIVRTADGLEFSVSGVGDTPFVIESTMDFKTWETYPTAVELSSVGKKSLRANILGANRFFRLRVGGSSPLGR